MLTVACVLRSGGDYKPGHVMALKKGVERYLSVPHEFVCLSDLSIPCRTIKLLNNWSGWWSKLELFRPAMFTGQVLYFDLDTLIVSPIDSLVARPHGLTVLRNFWGKTGEIGSGMMAWEANLEPEPFGMGKLYHEFQMAPRAYMQEYATSAKWGDQGFIREHSPRHWEYWQDRNPGKVVSFKAHCREGSMRSNIDRPASIPQGASVVCFHGQPRPWNTTLGRKHMELS